MPRSRKCSVCERRVSKKQKHVVDLDTGDRFHVKCYIKNYGDLPKNVKTVSENSIRKNPTRQEIIEGIKDEKEGAAKYKQWADEFYQKGDYDSAELMKEFASDELGHKAGLRGLALKNPEAKPATTGDIAKGLAKDVGGKAATTDVGKKAIRGAITVLRHTQDPYSMAAAGVIGASKLKGKKGVLGKVGRVAAKGEKYARGYEAVSEKVTKHIAPVAAGFIPGAGGIISPILAEAYKDENPKIIDRAFENLLATKEHGDIMLIRGNDAVYRWDSNLGEWKPEEKFLMENAGYNPSPVRSLAALKDATSAEVENPLKYSEGGYEKLPYGKYIRERQIDPEEFDPRSFKTRKTKGGHALIFGCPTGQWDAQSEKCRVGMKLQSILHPLRESGEKRFEKMWKSPKRKNVTEEQKEHVKKFASALGKMKNPIKRNAYFHKLRDHLQQSQLHYELGDKNSAAKHYFQAFGMWGGLTKPDIARFGRESPMEFDWYNKGYMLFGGAENPENAVDTKAITEAGKELWKFLNTPEGKKIASAAAKAGKDVMEMAAKAMSKTAAKVSNPEMNLIIGNKIKKALGAIRVIKRYHNKHKDGSGNFGYTVVAPSTKAFMGKYEEWFTLDGSYDSAGNSHRLTFATFSGSNRVSIPEAATYDQLVAIMKNFITQTTGVVSEENAKKGYLLLHFVKEDNTTDGDTTMRRTEYGLRDDGYLVYNYTVRFTPDKFSPSGRLHNFGWKRKQKLGIDPVTREKVKQHFLSKGYTQKLGNPEENPETIHLKYFTDPDTGQDWAERNKVDVLDIYYCPKVGQYVVKYRGFPVADEKHTSDAVVTEENPPSMPKAMSVLMTQMESE